MADATNYYHKTRRAQELAIYTFARCEQFIADIARSHKVSEGELAERVADLLYSQTRGGLLGTEDRVSDLPGTRPRRGRPPSAVAVANGSHDEASGLTARQQQALEWKQSGLKTKEIAHKMGISVPGAAYLVRAAEKNSTNPNPNPKTKETK